jgi:heme exporter protein A
VLEAVDLECERSERVLFSGVTFALRPGELMHVTGANGSGKTSLLRILCGLLDPVRGEVRWNGTPTVRLAEDFHRDLVYIGHLNGLSGDLTPAENLEHACALADLDAARDKVAHSLTSFGLERFAATPVRSLSQGQRRRAALARLALAERKSLWLLDEPFSALDADAVELTSQLIAKHRSRGGMLVVTAHETLPRPLAPTQMLALDGRNA